MKSTGLGTRILSMFLVLVMIFTMLPVNTVAAYAQETERTAEEISGEMDQASPSEESASPEGESETPAEDAEQESAEAPSEVSEESAAVPAEEENSETAPEASEKSVTDPAGTESTEELRDPSSFDSLEELNEYLAGLDEEELAELESRYAAEDGETEEEEDDEAEYVPNFKAAYLRVITLTEDGSIMPLDLKRSEAGDITASIGKGTFWGFSICIPSLTSSEIKTVSGTIYAAPTKAELLSAASGEGSEAVYDFSTGAMTCKLEPGDYYIGYKADYNGTTVSDLNGSYGVTVYDAAEADSEIATMSLTSEAPMLMTSQASLLGASGDDGLMHNALLINGSSTINANNFTVSYVQPMTFSVAGVTGTLSYTYAPEDDPENWQAISDGACSLAPGKYLLSYIYIDEDKTAHYSAENEFSFTVTKATLSTPTGLAWNGSDPSWNAVSSTTDGGTLPDGAVSGYEIAVYKDSVLQTTLSVNGQTQYDNFANHISHYGSGAYTFEITALVADSFKDFFVDSAASAASTAFTAPSVYTKVGNGISGTSPDSSNKALLIPGSNTPLTITATLKPDYSFTGWTIPEEICGVVIADPASLSTTVILSEAYSGTAELVITANAQDNAAPVISEFKYENLALSAKATDAQDGIASYAFSTASSASAVTADEWQSAASEQTDFVYELQGSGTYYFYAKDGGGNISSSGPVQVTKVHYNNFYANDVLTDKTDYYPGTELTLADTSRTAWVFDGWYTDPSFSSKITSITAHSDSTIEIYAKWEEGKLPDFTLSSYSASYDGTSHALQISGLEDVKGTLEYSWTKDGQPLSCITASCPVRNVADSGSYSVTVTLKDTAGDVMDTKTVSTAAIVAISKVALTVTAEDKSIAFGDAVPEFTFAYAGLVGADIEDETVKTANATTDYTVGSVAGDYTITTAYSSDNYNVTLVNGKLTVSPKSGELSVVLADPVAEYIFVENESHEPTAFTPAVVVKLGSTELTSDDYTVTYSDNANAGTGHIKVVLKGNYSGEKTVDFTIQKAAYTPEVSISNWYYGEQAQDPSVTNINCDNGTVTYYYAKVDSEGIPTEAYSTTRPTNAGKYKVYASVPETANYNASTIHTTDFEI